MKFGLIPEYAMGCDGTTTKVTITQGWDKSEMAYWPEAPKPRKKMEKLVHMLRQIVKEATGVAPSDERSRS